VSRRVVVEADGGSRGNPGPAGYGALVRDADTGELLREVAAGIGVASNNVAEYRGLIAGLDAALEVGATAVEVRMDSKLVVEQMSGRWQVKHPDMKVLAAQAATVVRQFPTVRFMHVRRELNKHADRLANEAMDAAAAGRVWVPPDPEPGAGTSTPAGTTPTASAAAVPAGRNTLYGWSASAGTPTVGMLLRHGETPMSVDKRFSGRGDIGLSERGEGQARLAARRLADTGAQAVVSSPLRRTRQTADVVAEVLGVAVATDDGLAETDFGAWEGLTFGEVGRRWPDELKAWLADLGVAPPGGESMASTASRVAAARDRIVSSHAGSTVVVVTHVTPIKLLLRDALRAPDDVVFRLHLDPASLTVVDWQNDRDAVVRSMNETTYLGELVTPAPGH
jgi:probable phosphoglycerate mutase